MTLSTLLNRPCTITRRLATGTRDKYGNRVPDEQTVSTLFELQQKRRDEQDDAGETSDTYWDAFFSNDTALRTGDTVTDSLTGEEYEVFGDPWHARNPRTQQESHLEVTLRRAAGSQEEVGS